MTGDAPRSLQAVARSVDSYVAANVCAVSLTAAALVELATVMTATISSCAALLAKATGRVRAVGLAAARASFSNREPWNCARRMVQDTDLAQQTLLRCRSGSRPTCIDHTQRYTEK
jgi:hypothetical protein